MTGSDTMLAYLVSSFPGNTENIATETLRHIFQHSDPLVEALNDVVQPGVRGIQPISRVESQVIQADGTRPDLVGFDEDCKERVLIEVKFWAERTHNQPNGYLNRLPDDGPGNSLRPGGNVAPRPLGSETARRTRPGASNRASQRCSLHQGPTGRVPLLGLLPVNATGLHQAPEPASPGDI
jgi:hypothetical protein